MGVIAEVLAFGEKLADESVGVFVDASKPGRVLNRVEAQKRLSITYDRGKEMALHETLSYSVAPTSFMVLYNQKALRTRVINCME